jgi:surface carbohydrate biosynthesis protein
MTASTDAFIRFVQPDLIITLIDNDPRFYTLLQRHPQLTTVSIQNGVRGTLEMQGLRRAAADGALSTSYLCVFGANSEDLYRKLVACETVRTGLIKNNSVPRTVLSKGKQTIGFVSQYKHPDKTGTVFQGHLFTWQEWFELADTIVLHFLKHYAARTNRNLLVIATPFAVTDPLSLEEVYFRRLLGDGYNFFAPRDICASVAKTDECKLVVAVDSTLGLEAIARGNRAAFFSIRSELLNQPDMRFGWPAEYADDGPFWTNVPDPAIFERIMDFLFAASDAEWKETLLQHNFERIMEYDSGNTRFKNLLADILVPAPSA